MADTFTSALGIRQPQTGAYNNSWGSVLNTDMMQLFDDAIAGQSVITVNSTSISLPAMTQGATANTRMFSMQLVGAPGGPVTATFPASVKTKFYLIDNQTGEPVTFTYVGSADTVTVQADEKRLIWADGSNVWNVLSAASDASSLGGVPSANWARQSRTATEISANTIVHNDFNGVTNANPYTNVTEAPTTIVNCNDSNCQVLTLTGNRTMGVPTNPRDGETIDLLVVQDATGNRTLTWNAIFLFEGGVAPVLATAPAAADRFSMIYNANLTKWFVGHFAGISVPAGASTIVNITGSTNYFNLLATLGTVSVATTVQVNVAPGVVIQALNAGQPAMDLSGLPAGSTVNLINKGYILGAGGDGADGAVASYPGSGGTILSAGPAGNGGVAIVGPGSSNAFNITNGAGFIWGGGGGGGGAGAYDGVSSGLGLGNGGGGGGGAGGGRGGKGARGVYILGGSSIAQDGQPGTIGQTGMHGTAGSSTSSGHGMTGTAGNGGDYGQDGTDGTAPGTVVTGHTGAFSTKGTAGKAIELLGAGAPTFLSGGTSPNVKGAVS